MDVRQLMRRSTVLFLVRRGESIEDREREKEYLGCETVDEKVHSTLGE